MSHLKQDVKYLPTIGMECHVQLSSVTKLFAAVGNDARQAPPNTLISHICLGMPGALPVLNAAAVQLSIKAAFALNTEPQKFSKFDRKHYFYPDLPKGYQITQFDQPIIVGGNVELYIDGHKKVVRINRVQLEEDAGKNIHLAGKDYSLVDLNRAGTPLLEIVSEPDIHSAQEAKLYARELWLLMRYANVSDGDMYYGNMRFDVNISVSSDINKLGLRSEIKNLNSFRSIEKAVEYEIKRQTELLAKGESPVQATRGWDESKQKTFEQRTKEEAHDYRYMPDPDIPPLVLEEKAFKSVQVTMPVLPGAWRKTLRELDLDNSQIETLIEAELDDGKVSYLPLVKQFLTNKDLAKKLADWFVNVEIPLRRGDKQINSEYSDDERLKMYRYVYELVHDDKLSSTNAKALITTILMSGAEPHDIEKYAEEQGFIQLSNEGDIEAIVIGVIAENRGAAEDVKKGVEKAIGFLVGQVMKKSLGKANPNLAKKLIRKHLA